MPLQLGDIVQQHHRAGGLAALAGERRCRQLDAALGAVGTGQHHRPPPQRHPHAGGEALPHGVRERAAVGLVDDRDDVGERLAGDLAEHAAEQLLGGRVHEVDAPVAVRGHEPVAERVDRGLCPAAADVRAPGPRQHLNGGEQHRRGAAVPDQRAAELEPRDLAVLVRDLHLVALGRRLAREAPADVVADQLGVVGRDEFGEVPADDVLRRLAEQRRETGVGEQDPLAMDQDRLVDGLRQLAERCLRRGDRRDPGTDRGRPHVGQLAFHAVDVTARPGCGKRRDAGRQ